jgi:KAP family P-loop domain
MSANNSSLLSMIAAKMVVTSTDQFPLYFAMATLIAPDLAITSDSVFGRERPVRTITLHFDGRADIPIETEATVVAHDPDFDIAVLRLKSSLQINLPPHSLADADTPRGASWQSLIITPSTPKGEIVTGTVVGPQMIDKILHLRLLTSRELEPGSIGAPIVVNDRIVGVIAGSNGGNSPKDNQWFAIPISAMLQSKAGGIIRSAMAAEYPLSAGAAPDTTETAAESKSGRTRRLNEDIYKPFGARALDALSLADGIRGQMQKDKVYMEYLIAGIFEKVSEPAIKLMTEARVNRDKVFEILSDHAKQTLIIPDRYEILPLSDLPPLSAHARQALSEADAIANKYGSKEILGRHLLYGALSVTECKLVKRLLELGLDKEKIVMRDEVANGGPLIAGFRPDEAEGKDLLGIGPEVEALCSVLAAKDVTPPLSLGLFGDWGSGKSFFMREMEKRINFLQKEAEKDDNSPYCKKIVQLWFNAWHYIDTELWASLASEIFDGLAESLPSQEDKEKVDDNRAQLIARQGELEFEKQKQRKIEERLEEVENGKTEIETNPWRIIVEAYRFAESQPDTHKKVREVEKTLDLKLNKAVKELNVSPDDVKKQLLEARGLWRQIRAIQVALGGIKKSKLWIYVFSVIILIPLFSWAVLQIIPALQSTITKFLTGLITLLTLLAPLIKYARGLLTPLTAAIEENRKLIEEERLKLQRELEKQQKLTTEKSAQVATVMEKLENLRADRKLANFIKQRKASADYTKYLGVIARAHDDFEQLSNLLRREQKRNPDDPDLVLPPIERIILYIDDLDRCPEDIVVQVLQAIHLLLAFPLFIVVVGVDSRWLLHSLQQHSSAFRENKANGSPHSEESKHWRSTPLNYLEKIFQIPFTLRPMGKSGFKDLINDLAKPQKTLSPVVSEAKPANINIQVGEKAKTAEKELPGKPDDHIKAPQSPPNGPTPPDIVNDPSRLPVTPDTKFSTEHMRIEDWEREVMKKLFPLIPSPRAAKRFVNIYRLLRASAPAENRAAFIGDEEHGQHRAVLALLAILIGYPDEATYILQGLLGLKQSLGKKPWNVEWWRFFQQFVPDNPENEGTGPDADSQQVEVAERWRDLNSKLIKTGLISAHQACDDFIDWAEEVARYSFQSGRVLLGRQQAEASAND